MTGGYVLRPSGDAIRCRNRMVRGASRLARLGRKPPASTVFGLEHSDGRPGACWMDGCGPAISRLAAAVFAPAYRRRGACVAFACQRQVGRQFDIPEFEPAVAGARLRPHSDRLWHGRLLAPTCGPEVFSRSRVFEDRRAVGQPADRDQIGAGCGKSPALSARLLGRKPR